MKPGTTYVRLLTREYMWALTMLVVRTMKEDEEKQEAYQRRLQWEKNKSDSL